MTKKNTIGCALVSGIYDSTMHMSVQLDSGSSHILFDL